MSWQSLLNYVKSQFAFLESLPPRAMMTMSGVEAKEAQYLSISIKVFDVFLEIVLAENPKFITSKFELSPYIKLLNTPGHDVSVSSLAYVPVVLESPSIATLLTPLCFGLILPFELYFIYVGYWVFSLIQFQFEKLTKPKNISKLFFIFIKIIIIN